MSVFIVEGCDKNGKTELCKKLVKEYDAVYFKFSAPKRDAYKEYSEIIDTFKTSKNCVLDRYLYGELIYGPIYRGKSQIKTLDMTYLELRLLAYNPVVILCETDVNTVIKNFEKCREEYTKPNDIKLIMDGYRKLLLSSILPVVVYNYQKDLDHENLFELLKSYVWSGSMIKDKYLKNHLGGEAVDILFVADQKNQNLKDKHVLDSISGRYLISLLHKLCILSESAFCNSISDGELVALDYLKSLDPRVVVSLGSAASKRLNYIGIKHRVICHPQYAKRFYGKNSTKRYLNEILEAIK